MDLDQVTTEVRQTWQLLPRPSGRTPDGDLTRRLSTAALTYPAAPMQFGFTLKPEHSIAQTIALARRAEALGFDHGWLFDSHVLWRDPYPLLTVMAENTTACGWARA